jgi:carbon-monoxide dehydrogenase large subunit
VTRYSISQPVLQVEAPRLLKGQGRFTDDVFLDRQSYAVFLRSPHAHAVIQNINVVQAQTMPGVLAVLTGQDYAADGLGHVRGLSPAKRRDGSPMFRPPRPGLARDKVRHLGQAVALVVADTLAQARAALEHIVVDYEVLQAHVSVATANDPATPPVWAECPDNEALYASRGDRKAADEAFARAKHVVRDRFVVSRVAASTMEPRAVVAAYDSGRESYTIYACHQRPYVWRTMLAEHVFNIPEQNIRLIAGDVGGSYGMKGGLYVEVPLVAWASKRIGRPVKWNCERSEALLADDAGRDMVIDAELALDADGTFRGMRFSSRNNVGAYISMLGHLSTGNVIRDVAGPYRIPAIFSEAVAVLTNTMCVSNYRAPGGAPSAYVIDRLVDMAAREIGMDAAEIRRRNLVPADAMPYKTPLCEVYESCDFPALFEKALSRADYVGFAQRRIQSQARGMLRGIGVSCTIDPSAGPSPETAEIRFDPGGNVTILVGSTAGGQSHETIYTQIVSGFLGIEAETIRVIEGDTGALSWGTGTGGARTATIGGTTVLKAAEKVLAKAQRIAAHLLEASPGDLRFENGTFQIAGTDRSIAFRDVAVAAFSPAKLPDGMELGLFETATWSPASGNLPNASHVCEVEIDPETGTVSIDRYTAVHDVGVELNPMLVEGQIHGSIAQALGQAVMEQVVFDEASGQLLTGSFMDYAMPRAADIPSIVIDRSPVPERSNPLGVKGAGECGTVGALPAVMNAINDALAPFGVRNLQMPCKPDKVWAALNGDLKAQVSDAPR